MDEDDSQTPPEPAPPITDTYLHRNVHPDTQTGQSPVPDPAAQKDSDGKKPSGHDTSDDWMYS